MNTIHLDEYDKRIVELLQQDSSISNIEEDWFGTIFMSA